MPRAESSKVTSGAGAHSPYHLAYDNTSAASTSTSPPSSSNTISIVTPPPRPASSASSTANASSQKKKHVCQTCERGFTTSGHLARHVRIHTGERNHACPFPGCQTRCSRQDNLQQHYRIHLSPGSRRSSGRSSNRRRVRTTMAPPSTSSTSSSPSSHSEYKPGSSPKSEGLVSEHFAPGSPPPLAPATLYHDRASPLSDSPPPLTTATTHSATYGSMPNTAYNSRQHSPSGRDSASPEPAFASTNLLGSHEGGSLDSQYASVGATYRHPYPNEQAQTTPYGYNSSSGPMYHQAYAHQTPPTEYQSPQAVSGLSAASTSLHQVHTRHSTPLSSRHSISHISHPYPQTHQQQQYANSSHSGASTMNPPSPASSHHSLTASHTSDPSTPTFPSTLYGGDSYTSQSSLADATSSSASNGYFAHAPHVVSSNAYALSNTTPLSADSTVSRFPSPPPILAPIHSTHIQNMASMNARRASMPILERHYSAPSIMTHQQQQYTAEASQAYAYERQSYGFKQGYEVKHDMDGYGRQEVYGGYREATGLGHAVWKGRGIGALVG